MRKGWDCDYDTEHAPIIRVTRQEPLVEQKLHSLLEYLSSPIIRVTRQESLVEQKLHTLLEYLSSPTIRVARQESLVEQKLHTLLEEGYVVSAPLETPVLLL
jgi:hypothetical protein